MRLSGKATYLTSFEERHLLDERYYSWVSDPLVMKYIGREEYLRPIGFAEVRKYVESLWADRRCTFLAVHHAADDAFIGTAKIALMDEQSPRRNVADIGVMIGDREYWGKRLSSDVLYSVCEYAFAQLGARKLTAGAMAPNTAVIKAFHRIGFREEGRLRNQLLVAGEEVDHVLLGCFRTELARP